MTSLARRIAVHGIVQGVGFRPFVYRLARQHGLTGWVLNSGEGVQIQVEAPTIESLTAFLEELTSYAPEAARIEHIEVQEVPAEGYTNFTIRESQRGVSLETGISPDLHVCSDCLQELFDPDDRRYRYPYINCTHCGPRYSIILALPYDREHTTMRDWPMCPACRAEYEDPTNRRFHAQPTACPRCGPTYFLEVDGTRHAQGYAAIEEAARLLTAGQIVAIKGIGGYHLACDARNAEVVEALRARKYRKEKPFALMAASLQEVQNWAFVPEEAARLLTSVPHPIVLLSRKPESLSTLPDALAPDNLELGFMLPYTPLHYLIFEAGAPSLLVMTSGNRSSEPITYREEEAQKRLQGIADAFLIGERPIARRVDDSVLRMTSVGPIFLRRSRGYAPGAVAKLPTQQPILGVGADLKNTLTLVVKGTAYVSPYIGDLEHYSVQESFQQTLHDLAAMYQIPLEDVLAAHDAHPAYVSTQIAQNLGNHRVAVQHHRAHIYAVLAERGAWEETVIGIALDGTGYGDDGSIWGGEFFVGSLREGLERVHHLYPAYLPGGDAAARNPVQAAAGFLSQLDALPDLTAPPFGFPPRFLTALEMIQKGIRSFPTTSTGRLFDTVAALLGFTRTMTFEGQAAIWLEHQARRSADVAPYPFPNMDYRPLLKRVIADRARGRPIPEIARAFHHALATSCLQVGEQLARRYGTHILVAAGGVFQNALLIELMHRNVPSSLQLWLPRRVSPNDESISLGQAAAALWRG